MDLHALVQRMIDGSEHVRRAIIGAEYSHFAETVGMGADGAVTSKIDQVAEEAALAWFADGDPPVNILSEEIGFIDRGSAITLIIDPVDATSNALASPYLQGRTTPDLAEFDQYKLYPHSEQLGFPYYAFSVAALVDNELVAACVRNLPTGNTWTATKDGGSHLNGIPVQVDPVETIERAWLAFVRPGGEQGFRHARHMMMNAFRIRITGCTALDISLIASGSLHGFANPNAHRPGNSGEKVVDYAGAMLILTEAGGVVSDTEGNPLPIDHDLARLTPPVAAATRELHQAMIQSIHTD